MEHQDQPHRVSKRKLLSRVARRSGVSLAIANSVYAGLMGELIDTVSNGDTVVLNGFGRFYRQSHRGHKVRFGKADIDDYFVLKFSASKNLNRQLGTATNHPPEYDIPAA